MSAIAQPASEGQEALNKQLHETTEALDALSKKEQKPVPPVPVEAAADSASTEPVVASTEAAPSTEPAAPATAPAEEPKSDATAAAEGQSKRKENVLEEIGDALAGFKRKIFGGGASGSDKKAPKDKATEATEGEADKSAAGETEAETTAPAPPATEVKAAEAPVAAEEETEATAATPADKPKPTKRQSIFASLQHKTRLFNGQEHGEKTKTKTNGGTSDEPETIEATPAVEEAPKAEEGTEPAMAAATTAQEAPAATSTPKKKLFVSDLTAGFKRALHSPLSPKSEGKDKLAAAGAATETPADVPAEEATTAGDITAPGVVAAEEGAGARSPPKFADRIKGLARRVSSQDKNKKTEGELTPPTAAQPSSSAPPSVVAGGEESVAPAAATQGDVSVTTPEETVPQAVSPSKEESKKKTGLVGGIRGGISGLKKRLSHHEASTSSEGASTKQHATSTSEGGEAAKNVTGEGVTSDEPTTITSEEKPASSGAEQEQPAAVASSHRRESSSKINIKQRVGDLFGKSKDKQDKNVIAAPATAGTEETAKTGEAVETTAEPTVEESNKPPKAEADAPAQDVTDTTDEAKKLDPPAETALVENDEATSKQVVGEAGEAKKD